MSAWFTKRACAVAFAVCVGSALVPAWAGRDQDRVQCRSVRGRHSRIRHLRAPRV